MKPFGGFDHNAQTLRVVTQLEQRYAEFDGLNLTWETLEGVVKHNGPLAGERRAPALPRAIGEYVGGHELDLDHSPAPRRRSPRSPTTSPTTTTTSTTACAPACSPSPISPMCRWSARFSRGRVRYPGLEAPRLIHEAVRRLIGRMVGRPGRRDATAPRRERPEVGRRGARTRRARRSSFSAEMRRNDGRSRISCSSRCTATTSVNRMTSKARPRGPATCSGSTSPSRECLPTEWRRLAAGPDDPQTARVAADYLAGMTDRFAADEHRRLFDVQSRIS